MRISAVWSTRCRRPKVRLRSCLQIAGSMIHPGLEIPLSPMKALCARALVLGLLGVSAAHAQNAVELDVSLGLRGAESLGEAAAQTALQAKDSPVRLPVMDSTPDFVLQAAESLGEAPLAVAPLPTLQQPSVPAPSAALPVPALPVAPLPSAPLPSVPLPSVPLAVGAQAAEKDTEKEKRALQTELQGELGKQTSTSRSVERVATADRVEEGKFGLVPIRWGGDVSETLRWKRYRHDEMAPAVTSLENMQMLNLRASSYLWQPWLAQVGGNIGLVHSTSNSDTSSGKSNYLTGGGTLALLSRSRFPFRASYDVSNSRTSMTYTNTDYTNKRLGLQQDYRSASGESLLVANFDQSTMSNSAAFGEDTVMSARGSYSTRFGTSHSASMTVRHTESEQERTNSGLKLNGFTAQHSYRPSPLLSVDTHASVTDSVFNSQSTGTTSSTATRYAQANSYANWRPDEDKPLYFYGGANLLDGRNRYAGNDFKTQGLSGNAGVNYNASRNLTVGATASVARTDSGNVSSVSTMQSANASYNADVINYKKISYNRNVALGLSNQTDSATTNNQRIMGAAGHSLYSPVQIGEGSLLSFSASQNLSSYYDRLYGMSNTLNHSGGMSWSGSQGESLTGAANAAVGDVHTYGYNEANYQYATLHLNSKKQFSLHSFLLANASLNWNHQGISERTTTGIDFTVSYQHLRAFRVRGLQYLLLFRANNVSYDERLRGNVDAQRSQHGYAFEQYLNYRIGKLDTSLSAILSEYDRRQDASLFVRIGRNFGNM